MKEWDMSPPPPSDLGDHDVFRLGNHLVGKRVALLVTGGIAAMKAPFIARSLRQQGADVVAYVSSEALRYTTSDALEWSTTHSVVSHLSPFSEHLSDTAPFDIFLVAPATYNTINKMANGVADGVVSTTLASAIGRMEQGKSKVLIAPTMHHSLHNSILTASLKKLKAMGVYVIPPREGNGKHNIPHERTLTAEVCRAASCSALKAVPILVTGGPTPVPIDNVRRIVSRFSGKLGVKILEELYLRGADVLLIHGEGGYAPPEHLPYVVARTYDDYFRLVMDELGRKDYGIGIFSAGVADYKPETTSAGKIASGKLDLSLNLAPTVKVIDEVRERFPSLFMLTFKYQENITHNELMKIVHKRLDSGYPAIVANRGEEVGPNGEQIAHLVTSGDTRKFLGKQEIAIGIADYLEEVWRK